MVSIPTAPYTPLATTPTTTPSHCTSTSPTQLPVLCSTPKPGSILPPTCPPILGEQARQIGRVGSDIWEELRLVGGSPSWSLFKESIALFLPLELLHCFQSSFLFPIVSQWVSRGPRLIGNQGPPCQYTSDPGMGAFLTIKGFISN